MKFYSEHLEAVMYIEKLKQLIVLTLRRLGIVATRLSSSPEGRIQRLLATYRVDSVIDIGANVGQYARLLRNELGYTGNIFSFEPMRNEFDKLQRAAKNDARWHVFNFGLGDVTTTMKINISRNSASSSLLSRSVRLSNVAPETEVVGSQSVQIRTLDDVYPELNIDNDRVYLKIDAQGYEDRILKGGARVLRNIDTVQLEMPLTATYQGTSLFEEFLAWMLEHGYRLTHIIPGFYDKKTGELLECDGVFHRF